MIRKAIACPRFYPKAFSGTDKLIKDAFLHKEGPGTLPVSRREIQNKFIVAPCDVYERMGPCAAWAHKELAESWFPEAYIILGANTSSAVKCSTYLFTDWETPLGPLKVHKELGRALIQECPKVLNEHTGHAEECSVEIQLPFLQFASRDQLPGLAFIPLVVNMDKENEVRLLGEKLGEFIQKHPVVLVVSASIEDTATLQYIQSMDTVGLINYRKRKRKAITPVSPLLVFMEIAKHLKKKVSVLNYQSSYDATGNRENVVHYASLSLK